MKRLLSLYYRHELVFLRLVEANKLLPSMLAFQTLFIWFLVPLLVILPLGMLLESTGFASILLTGLVWISAALMIFGVLWAMRLVLFLGEVEVFRTDPLGSHRGTKMRIATIQKKLGTT